MADTTKGATMTDKQMTLPENQAANQQAATEPGPLDQVVEATQTKQQQIVTSLENAQAKIEEVLPHHMRGQAKRLIKRAALYFSRKPELGDVTNASFIQCVLDAAELGLAIDGRLCHAVRYNNKKKLPDRSGKLREQMVPEAQCMVDYKGLIAVAKRCAVIEDIEAVIVHANDTFTHSRDNDQSQLSHTYDVKKPRGDKVAVYVRVWMPGGHWRYDILDREEIASVRSRSRASTGPWRTDEGEMWKKTGLRRMLKTFADDPGAGGIADALALDEGDIDFSQQVQGGSTSKVEGVDLSEILSDG